MTNFQPAKAHNAAALAGFFLRLIKPSDECSEDINMTAQADAKYYTALEVFFLTGIPQEKQYQWKDRSVVVPSRQDKRPSGSGDPSLMRIETVYQFAITAELVELGLMAKHAASAARKFTDETSPGRSAGKLFPEGRTILALRPTGAVVLNAQVDADFSELSDFGVAFAAVDCGKICKEVDSIILNTPTKPRKKK